MGLDQLTPTVALQISGMCMCGAFRQGFESAGTVSMLTKIVGVCDATRLGGWQQIQAGNLICDTRTDTSQTVNPHT